MVGQGGAMCQGPADPVDPWSFSERVDRLSQPGRIDYSYFPGDVL
jgi:hypothetical protein